MKYIKPANFSTLFDDICDAVRAVFAACLRAARALSTQPWPVLLCLAIVGAFALTIVPLALVLFVCFLLIKFAVAALVVDKQRRRG